jgi:hypothetical protein
MTTSEIQWEDRFVGGSRFADGSAIIRPAEVAWTEGPIEGLRFRLTHVDRSSAMWTALFKVEANVRLPAYFNHGEVQVYVLEGNLTIGEVTLGVGDYLQDIGGVARETMAGPAGATYFVMYTGGLSVAGADGKPNGRYIDASAMYDIAAANGAAAHLPSPS